MQLAVNDVLGTNVMRYRMYIFQILSIVLHIISVIIPLVKVFYTKSIDDSKKVYIYIYTYISIFSALLCFVLITFIYDY